MKRRKYEIKEERIISDSWGKLQAVRYEVSGRDGQMHEATEEVYDIGNAVAVLLYDKARGTVLLNRQFRLVTVYNGLPDGMLTEVCAGKIEGGLSPEETVRKEIREETGYAVGEVTPVMRLYMSPGALTETLYFYVAAYTPAEKVEAGGGKADEGEAIELQEIPFSEAMEQVKRGEIVDAKTVILLQYAALQGIFGTQAGGQQTS